LITVEGLGGIKATVVADSISVNGDRITTFELEYHRYIHGEVMTHRCLVGDTDLYFDLPSGKEQSKYRLYKKTIKEFYDAWTEGAKPRKPSRWKNRDTSKIEPDKVYSAKELCELLGYSSASNMRKACREGNIPVINKDKSRSEDFKIKGSAFLDFCNKPEYYKQNIKGRLSEMRVRMLDQNSGEVRHTTITDIWKVGIKPTYELVAGGIKIRGTDDHPILTDKGWKNLGEITKQDKVVQICNRKEDVSDGKQHKLINGKWRSSWQLEVGKRLSAIQGGTCSSCGREDKLEIHHLKPVYKFPELTFDEANVVAVCNPCHKELHKKQGWQTGNPLNAVFLQVDSVAPTGEEEEVYDLSVDDENHNFVANGIVVHNCFSRNAMSSRAVPVSKMIEQSNATPIHFGKNQSGMQAEFEHDDIELGQSLWDMAKNDAKVVATQMAEQGFHKQVVNRILEPFQMMKVVLTATEFENFFWLRLDSDAQPEIQELAKCMFEGREKSVPEILKVGEWHTPYVEHHITDSNILQYIVPTAEGVRVVDVDEAIAIASSSCAQVSYRSIDNSYEKAMTVYDRLGVGGSKIHASPFENVVTPMDYTYLEDMTVESDIWPQGITHMDRKGNFWSGNFKGWVQHRQLLENHTKW
jgi:hypothetical protein